MSERGLFSLSIDFSRLVPMKQQFLAFIDANKLIETWTSPFEGIYLLISTSTSEELSKSVNSFVGNMSPFIISKLERMSNYGTLPEQSWQWLHENGIHD